jgi:F0F1-type ATP synthase membrane subunit a
MEPTGGAVGVGLVLVLFPCAALYFGIDKMRLYPEVSLPILAIFGIMILFGAMALVSTLFARLSLSDKREALALPPGSIRAAIALALIVLFSIISIMLYQSLAGPYVMRQLSEADKTAIVANPVNHVLAVMSVTCQVKDASAAKDSTVLCYDVHLVRQPGQEASDLAKQLLVMIGTLMTSVTSFYFATQATAASNALPDKLQGAVQNALAAVAPQVPVVAPLAQGATAAVHGPDDHVDGCDVPITDSTPDTDLPATKGGVEQ